MNIADRYKSIMSKIQRIAIYNEAADLNEVGGGGAQRFYLNIFRDYHLQPQSQQKFKLFFFASKSTYKSIQSTKSLNDQALKHLKWLPNFNNRFKAFLENSYFIFCILWYRIRLVHIAHYFHVPHFALVKTLNKLPKFMRPKIGVTFVHCEFPYGHPDPNHRYYKTYNERFNPLFKQVHIDGVFAYYKLFEEYCRTTNLIDLKTHIHSIEHYCCDTTLFKPLPKENIIIYAARFNILKQPLMFVEAMNLLNLQRPDISKNWRIIMCGNGELEDQVKQRIDEYNLSFIEVYNHISNMSELFGKSKAFVSTQSFENFTSLSMNEALASGNAIISRNVGQTNLYLKDGENGFFASEDTSLGITNAIIKYCDLSEEEQFQFQQNSLKQIEEVHNFGNFVKELETFWETLLSK